MCARRSHFKLDQNASGKRLQRSAPSGQALDLAAASLLIAFMYAEPSGHSPDA